jgi:hypothetical protein
VSKNIILEKMVAGKTYSLETLATLTGIDSVDLVELLLEMQLQDGSIEEFPNRCYYKIK